MKILDILNENWGNSRQFGSGERPQDQQLIEKSTTEKQARTMAAAAHDAKFAKKVGIKQSVAKEFNRADTGTKQLSKAMKHKPKNEVIDPGVGMGTVGGQWGNSKMEEDWNKVNHHDKTNGLSQKAVNAYRREHPGSHLQTAVTTKPSKLKKGSKAAKRRKSFCARMSGNKGPMKKPNGKPTPKALALRRWNCESIEEMAQMILEGEQMIAGIKQEGWSQKYKNSINCSHPKGFSQRAHCAGKKKHNEDMTMESICPDCGMCESHGNLNEIKKGAKDSNGFTKCWPGHHAAGTKKGKNGGQVRNCVPNESVKEGILPVGPVVAALRMFNRQREAYELFTKKFPSVQEAETWASKNNAELHNISPVAQPKPISPEQTAAMLDQIKMARKFGDE
jgi:hypothetical protein